MKKAISILLCFIIIFGFSSCSQNNRTSGTRRPVNTANSSVQQSEETSSQDVSYEIISQTGTSQGGVSSQTGVSSQDTSVTETSYVEQSSQVSSDSVSRHPDAASDSESSESDDVSSATSSVVSIPEVNEYKELTVPAIDMNSLGYLKIDGRYQVASMLGRVPQGLSCDFSSTCFAMNLDCEGDVSMQYEIKIRDSRATTVEEYQKYYVRVFVDGVDVGKVAINGTGTGTTSGEVTIVTGLSRGKHEIKFYKCNDVLDCLLAIGSFTFNGVPLDKPTDADRYIEFIGDSYTAGYGSLITGGEYFEYPDSPAHSDSTTTYAALAASALGADYSTICGSGMEFMSGHSGHSIVDFINAICVIRGSQKMDFATARHPNLVVMSIGCNDSNHISKNGYTEDGFKNGISTMIDAVKQAYPNAKIIFYYNGKEYTDVVEQTVVDSGAYFLNWNTSKGNNHSGHPTPKRHQQAADVLVDFINQNNLM